MIIFITSIASTFAQKTFQQADIVKKWTRKNTNGAPIDWVKEFTDTGKAIYYDWTILLETDYYLSDTVEKTFDESKVNQNTKGKFLVFNNKNCHGNHCVSIHEILSLTDDKFILKDVPSGIYTMYTTNKDSILYSYDDYVKLKLSLNLESFTQQTFQKKDITDKKWFLVYPNRKYEYYYYLSNEKLFDPSKFGKSTSGKYLFLIDISSSGTCFYEILKLTDKKLILKPFWPPTYIKKFVYEAAEE